MGKIFTEPTHPVVHPAPGVAFTLKNLTLGDYGIIALAAVAPIPFAYRFGGPNRVSVAQHGAFLSAVGGAYFAYQNSFQRLMGYRENSRQVQKYGEYTGEAVENSLKC